MHSDFSMAVVVGICLICASANATTPTNPHQQILQSTGMSALLKIVPQEISASANSHALRCGAGATTPPAPAAGDQALSAAMSQTLASSTSITEASAIARWYLSVAGSRITALEQQPATDNNIKAYAENRSNNPQWMATRYPLFKQIYDNTGAGAVNAIIGVEIEYAGLIVSGCIEKYAKDHQAGEINAEQVMAGLIRSDKDMMMQIFKQDSLFTMAFTLRSLSNAELNAYANFTEVHRDYYQSLVQAFELALQHYSDKLALQRATVTAENQLQH